MKNWKWISLVCVLVVANIIFGVAAFDNDSATATDEKSLTQTLSEKEAELAEKEKAYALRDDFDAQFGNERQLQTPIIQPVEGGEIYLFISKGKARVSADSEEMIDVTIETLYISGLFYDLRAMPIQEKTSSIEIGEALPKDEAVEITE